jgi:tetratricopeptide (TPR) repeat protein
MPTLRIASELLPPAGYGVTVTLADSEETREAHSAFVLQEIGSLKAELGWYFESYPRSPHGAAPEIARRIVGQLGAFGEALFHVVFEMSDEGREIWKAIEHRLTEVRIEIATTPETDSIPWEWMRVRGSETPLALQVSEIVRVYGAEGGVASSPALPDGRLRVLLVISRPSGTDDIPIRMMARAIGTAAAHRNAELEVRVLRPPTLERLSAELKQALARGEPYHAVHFDGHGIVAGGSEGMVVGPPRGYLLFEDGTLARAPRLVHGTAFGEALREGGVGLAVLNSCRSAYTELPDAAASQPEGDESPFGSFALETIGAGVSVVVAMRYMITPDTASRVVTTVYHGLLGGMTAAGAATHSRQQLHRSPHALPDGSKSQLEDWLIPVVYTSAGHAQPGEARAPQVPGIEVPQARPASVWARFQGALPDLPQPEVALVGRDAALLELDRLFSVTPVALLHGMAGVGKSAVAAVFASWYRATGGVEGPVFHTPLRDRTSFAQVMDDCAGHFGEWIAAEGIEWQSAGDDEREELVLELLSVGPSLWIFDDLASLRPGCGRHRWTEAERTRIARFFSRCCRTRARLLLLSRTSERDWLQDFPGRVPLYPLPDEAALNLLATFALEHGQQTLDLDAWGPNLELANGNAAIIAHLAREVFSGRLTLAENEPDLAARLRRHLELVPRLAALADREEEGGSPGGMLDEAEWKQLRLLEWISGIVDPLVLAAAEIMEPWKPGGDTARHADGAAEKLDLVVARLVETLSRLEPSGLVMPLDRAGRAFGHPLLPHRVSSALGAGPRPESQWEFVQTAKLSAELLPRAAAQQSGGLPDPREMHDRTLLLALAVALHRGWVGDGVSIVVELREDFYASGRIREWGRLLEQLTPFVADPDTGGPVQGLGDSWRIVIDWRVRFLMHQHEWADAAEMQRRLIRYLEGVTAEPHARDPQRLSFEAESASAAWLRLAQIELSGKSGAPNDSIERAIALARESGSREHLSDALMAQSQFCMRRRGPGDAQVAERSASEALKLRDPEDRQGRAICLAILGEVAARSALEAAGAEEKRSLLERAEKQLRRALGLFPPEVWHPRGGTLLNLGRVLAAQDRRLEAFDSFTEAARLFSTAGDH